MGRNDAVNECVQKSLQLCRRTPRGNLITYVENYANSVGALRGSQVACNFLEKPEFASFLPILNEYHLYLEKLRASIEKGNSTGAPRCTEVKLSVLNRTSNVHVGYPRRDTQTIKGLLKAACEYAVVTYGS